MGITLITLGFEGNMKSYLEVAKLLLSAPSLASRQKSFGLMCFCESGLFFLRGRRGLGGILLTNKNANGMPPLLTAPSVRLLADPLRSVYDY